MKNWKKLILIAAALAAASVWVQAGGTSHYLDNGFEALFYHSIRLEEAIPSIDPIGLAAVEFERAAREDGAGEGNLMLGLIYQYLNRPGTALGYYLEFAGQYKEEAWINSLIGDLHVEMGRLGDARTFYERAIEGGEPGEVFSQAYVGLGDIALEQKDYQEAKAAYSRALAESGDYVDARLGLGKAHYYLAEYEEALEVLEEAQLLAPRSAALHYYLGLCYEALGRSEQAEHAFQRVDELL